MPLRHQLQWMAASKRERIQNALKVYLQFDNDDMRVVLHAWKKEAEMSKLISKKDEEILGMRVELLGKVFGRDFVDLAGDWGFIFEDDDLNTQACKTKNL